MPKHYRMYTVNSHFHVTASDDANIFDAIDAVEELSGELVSGGYGTTRTIAKSYEHPLTIGT